MDDRKSKPIKDIQCEKAKKDNFYDCHIILDNDEKRRLRLKEVIVNDAYGMMADSRSDIDTIRVWTDEDNDKTHLICKEINAILECESKKLMGM